jgi:hypothetical protein
VVDASLPVASQAFGGKTGATLDKVAPLATEFGNLVSGKKIEAANVATGVGNLLGKSGGMWGQVAGGAINVLNGKQSVGEAAADIGFTMALAAVPGIGPALAIASMIPGVGKVMSGIKNAVVGALRKIPIIGGLFGSNKKKKNAKKAQKAAAKIEKLLPEYQRLTQLTAQRWQHALNATDPLTRAKKNDIARETRERLVTLYKELAETRENLVSYMDKAGSKEDAIKEVPAIPKPPELPPLAHSPFSQQIANDRKAKEAKETAQPKDSKDSKDKETNASDKQKAKPDNKPSKKDPQDSPKANPKTSQPQSKTNQPKKPAVANNLSARQVA